MRRLLDKSRITSRILLYKKGKLNFETILREISLHTYRLMKEYLRIDNEERNDFFCFFHSRMCSIINKFQYRGKPFDSYLKRTMRMQYKSFQSLRIQEERRERLFTREIYWDIHEYPAEYNPSETFERGPYFEEENKKNIQINDGIKRRLLFLILKASVDLSTDFIEHISVLTGYARDYLAQIIHQLNARMDERIRRYHTLVEKRNRYFFRVHYLQDCLETEYNEKKCKTLIREINENHARMESVIKNINKISLAPTHRDVAEILGIPKGTVDSGLYYLRQDYDYLTFPAEEQKIS